jgi:hypothetical protein
MTSFNGLSEYLTVLINPFEMTVVKREFGPLGTTELDVPLRSAISKG